MRCLSRRVFACSVFLITVVALSGCSPDFQSPEVATQTEGSSFAGAIMGGHQPIASAKLYMYAADTSSTAYGHASDSLLVNYTSGSFPTAKDTSGNYYVTTDSNGNFSIAAGEYSCTSGQQVYLLGLGGNPGAGVNSSIALLATLGTCSSSGTFATVTTGVVINEVSTIVTAYTLAGFATSPTGIASTSTTLSKQGLANAFANAANLYNVNTGSSGALAITPNGNGTVPQALLNTLGNILAACVDSSGSTSLACSTLFTNAASGGGTSGTAPTDTATAAINIAHHPASAASTLFSLQGSTFPFAPNLSSTPNDLTVGITFTGLTVPNDLAIDDTGSVWVTGTNKAYKLSALGVPITGSPFTVTGANEVTIDPSDNVYFTTASSGLYKLSSTGVAASGSPFLASSFNNPNGLTNNGTTVVLANTGGNDAYVLSTAGVNQTGSPYALSACTPSISQLAADGAGYEWTSAAFSGTVCRANVSTGSMYTVAGLSTPQRIGVDKSANGWVATAGASSLTKVTSTGGTTTYTGGGLSTPFGVAVDGSGNIWLANTGSNTVSEFASTGTAVTSSAGFTAGSQFNTPKNIAIDPSGNVWVTNSSSSSGNSVTELLGAATPVVTPLATGVKNNTLGTEP